jgi:hypothetical protein
MKTLRFHWLLVLLVPISLNVDAEPKSRRASFDRLFDQYSIIRWEDEKARLDNFAIQLINDPEVLGYIFVNDGKQMCRGEAQARAMRAKRYVVEHRGVAWNRVMWRIDGYTGDFLISLQPVNREVPIGYPFLGYPKITAEVYVTENCRSRIAKIRRSKWN